MKFAKRTLATLLAVLMLFGAFAVGTSATDDTVDINAWWQEITEAIGGPDAMTELMNNFIQDIGHDWRDDLHKGNEAILVAMLIDALPPDAAFAQSITAKMNHDLASFLVGLYAPVPPPCCGPPATIFGTTWPATVRNWLLFFLCFGWVWMWFF